MFEQALHWFIDLGSTVFIPIIIIILGLVVRLKPSKAVVAGLTIGIGFIGLNMVVALMQDSLGAAVQAMVDRYSLSLSIIDLGSGPGGPLAFSSTLGVLMIPIAFGVNLVLVWLGMTKTLNVDVWNLWQPTFVGLMVWGVTGNYALGLVSMVPIFLLQLLCADLAQPKLSKFFGLPSIAITHLMALSGMVLAVPLNWVFDHLPGLDKVKIDADTIEKKFGVLGDPIIIGFLIGVVIGLFAGYDVSQTLQLAVQMAAVLKLLPKMIAMFMEGLTPIAEATQAFTEKRLHGRDVNIGMDAAITVGNPSVMATCLLMIPITLFVAVVLPGNKVLPFGDLPLLVFVFTLMVAAFKGDILRSLIGCTIYTVTELYLASWMAPAVTAAFHVANYDVGSGVVSFVSAGLWPNVIGLTAAENLGFAGVAIFTLVVLVALFYVNRVKKFNQ